MSASERREHGKVFHRIIDDRQPISEADLWSIAESVLGEWWDVETAREAFDDLIDDVEIEQDRSENWWLT